MRRFPGVERRLFQAVMVVLASHSSDALAQPKPRFEPDRPFITCGDYKRKPFRRDKEHAQFDSNQMVIKCTIIRDEKQTTSTITYTPKCCRAGMPKGATCPPARKIKVTTTTTQFERVEIDPSGLARSHGKFTKTTDDLPPRHNCGRRPEGWIDEPCGDGTGAALAAMAELEAASVPAFERLARELAHHGAPASLVREARRAIGDEIRHARMMRKLAIRYGSMPRAHDLPVLPIRDLFAIARENVVEGCVREAYGALIATYQAHAAAPELRDTFEAIAVDERRHAALADAVHAWIAAQLDGGERRSIARARHDAEIELRASLASVPSNAVLGLPPADRATALFDAYFS